MDEKLGKFIDNFADLVQLAQAGQRRQAGGKQLLEALTEHLGVPAEDLAVVVEDILPHRFVDADILLTAIAGEDPDSSLVGIGGGDQRHHQSLSDMLQRSQLFPHFPLAQPDYTNLAVGPDEQRQVMALGLWLFTHGGHPLAVLQRDANPRYGRQAASLEVLAPDAQSSAEFLARFRRRMGIAHRDALKEHGQHLKRGILLYGKPGTGKTHTVRYLLSQSEGSTAILLSGGTLARVSEAARMARALQPSIVILEDCDLIAEDRSFGHGPQPLLFEVLDAMDGLDNDADVAFVLTTNRVDMLERALAQRPGRVDLAVEIPLPALAERVELLKLYGRRVAFGPEAIDDAAERTEGTTTASFARELVRRVVVAAALEGVPVADAHLLAAVGELMADGETLTRSLLGSGAGPGRVGVGGAGSPPSRGTSTRTRRRRRHERSNSRPKCPATAHAVAQLRPPASKYESSSSFASSSALIRASRTSTSCGER